MAESDLFLFFFPSRDAFHLAVARRCMLPSLSFQALTWSLRIFPSLSITIKATYRLRSARRTCTDTHTWRDVHTLRHLIRGVRCCDLIPNLSSAGSQAGRQDRGLGLDQLKYGGKGWD